MGRILGFDFGTRRIGVAVSDPRRSIATPLEVYARRDPARDADHFRTLIREHEADALVVGLPLHTGGGEGESAALARRFGAWLARETGLPVAFRDERYTSADAEDALRAHDMNWKKRREKLDMLAAQILLQNYLDAGCPADEPPPAPIEDPPSP